MSLNCRGAHCEVGAGVACPQGGLGETPVDKGAVDDEQTKSGDARGWEHACLRKQGWRIPGVVGGVVSPAGIEPAFKV